MQFRYPDADISEIRTVFRQYREAETRGIDFKLSGEHPSDENIPINPGFRSKGRYEYAVDIDAYGFSETGGRGELLSERYHRFYSDRPISQTELEQMIFEFISDQLEKYPQSVPIEEDIEQLEPFDVGYRIVTIERSS